MEQNIEGSDKGGDDLPVPRFGLIEPLREPTFRTIWIASLFSNVGQLIQGVGAAWMMTRLTSSEEMVALVQTALALPIMLLALPAGAIADVFDRRKVALLGLSLATAMAAGLTLLAWGGLLTPWLLLAACFMIGIGVALYFPAWQAAVGEQVSTRNLPAAVALGTISFNIARSVGPAIGGIVVAALGAVVAFATNALFYLPLMLAYFRWDRPQLPSRLPPERIDRAIISGVRYATHSPPIRVALLRALASAFCGASVSALTPLIAQHQLGGEAATYGLLLGAYGVGAVLGALGMDMVRARLTQENAARALALLCGLMIVVTGFSHSLVVSLAALMLAGTGWMILMAQFNVSVQLAAPRWVTARALSCFGCAMTGGLAFGAMAWGAVAGHLGSGPAMIVSGAAFMLTPLLGLLWPMDNNAPQGLEMAELEDLEVSLALTPRSGPIQIEVDYRVDTKRARDFYEAMQKMRRVRLRSGGFGWALVRDVTDPEKWIEQFHCPTWGDYLRMRTRFTQADTLVRDHADSFHLGGSGDRIRRRLERPAGSVRWHADTPDRQVDNIAIYP